MSTPGTDRSDHDSEARPGEGRTFEGSDDSGSVDRKIESAIVISGPEGKSTENDTSKMLVGVPVKRLPHRHPLPNVENGDGAEHSKEVAEEVKRTKRQALLFSLGGFFIFMTYISGEVFRTLCIVIQVRRILSATRPHPAETAINGRDGYFCLLSTFTTQIGFLFIAPWLVIALGPRPVLMMSASCYVFYPTSFFLPKGISMLACAAGGMGGACFWSAYGSYMSMLAERMSRATGRAYSDCASELNAIFFTVHPMAGVTANFGAAAVVQALQGAGQELFLGLMILAACGLTTFSTLPDPEGKTGGGAVCGWPLCLPRRCPRLRRRSGEASSGDVEAGEGGVEGGASLMSTGPAAEEQAQSRRIAGLRLPALLRWARGGGAGQPTPTSAVPSPLFLCKFIVSDKRMQCMVLIFLANGAKNGFFVGAFMDRVVSRLLGTTALGMCGGLYGLCSVLAMRFWARVCGRPSWGRRWAYVFAVPLQAGFFIAFLVWSFYNPRLSDAAHPSTDEKAPPIREDATMFDWAFVLGGVCLLGIVNPVCDAMSRATAQVIFRNDKRELACAVSGLQMAFSLGNALQSALSLSLRGKMHIQYTVLCTAFTMAGLTLLHLHRHITRIDPTAELPDASTEADKGGPAEEAGGMSRTASWQSAAAGVGGGGGLCSAVVLPFSNDDENVTTPLVPQTPVLRSEHNTPALGPVAVQPSAMLWGQPALPGLVDHDGGGGYGDGDEEAAEAVPTPVGIRTPMELSTPLMGSLAVPPHTVLAWGDAADQLQPLPLLSLGAAAASPSLGPAVQYSVLERLPEDAAYVPEQETVNEASPANSGGSPGGGEGERSYGGSRFSVI